MPKERQTPGQLKPHQKSFISTTPTKLPRYRSESRIKKALPKKLPMVLANIYELCPHLNTFEYGVLKGTKSSLESELRKFQEKIELKF